jgi:hypothetical protein
MNQYDLWYGPEQLLHQNDIVFYHPCDLLNIEYMYYKSWSQAGNPIKQNFIIDKGLTCPSSDSFDRIYSTNPIYKQPTDVDSLTACFWLGENWNTSLVKMGWGTGGSYTYGFHLEFYNDQNACLLFINSDHSITISGNMDWSVEHDTFFVLHAQWNTGDSKYHISWSHDGNNWIEEGALTGVSKINSSNLDPVLEIDRENGEYLQMDEAVLWLNTPKFTNFQLSNLYELANTNNSPMNEYMDYYLFSHSGEMPLFIQGHEPDNKDITLFASGVMKHNESLDLFTHGRNSYSGFIDTVITGHLPINSGFPLYSYGFNEYNNSINLFINGHEPFSNISGIPLFIESESGVYFDNIFLIIQGAAEEVDVSCPILDPTASIQISSGLVQVYQDHIDALINQLGKNILLEFDPIITVCPNCIQDTIRQRSSGRYNGIGPEPFVRGRKCPVCKGDGVLETPETRCIKCLIKWNSKDYANKDIRYEKGRSIVRTKCLMSQAPLIQRCRTALMNYDISNQLTLRVKRLRSPVPAGLRDKRYCITFWEIVED